MFKGLSRNDLILLVGFTAFVLLMPIILKPVGAAYPALMQKFCIFGIFAIGFNILFHGRQRARQHAYWQWRR